MWDEIIEGFEWAEEDVVLRRLRRCVPDIHWRLAYHDHDLGAYPAIETWNDAGAPFRRAERITGFFCRCDWHWPDGRQAVRRPCRRIHRRPASALVGSAILVYFPHLGVLKLYDAWHNMNGDLSVDKECVVAVSVVALRRDPKAQRLLRLALGE